MMNLMNPIGKEQEELNMTKILNTIKNFMMNNTDFCAAAIAIGNGCDSGSSYAMMVDPEKPGVSVIGPWV